MSDSDYTQQLEETIESLNKKLDEVSYYKPVWSQEIIPGNGNGKLWVLQLQGNPVSEMYKKKVLSYKSGSHKQRSRWANSTIEKEIMCVVRFTGDNRCVPHIFGKEHEWQPSFEACKKYANRIIFGVDDI